MDKKRSLQYNFGFEAIPFLFHGQTSGFMKYLEKDGVDLLKFWWNHIGDQLEESKRVSPTGISLEIDPFDKKTSIVTVTLPTAKEDGDPMFLALVARPERRFAWVKFPNTEIFVLSRYDGCKAQYLTAFGELSPRAIYREIGVGLKPSKLDFKRVVKTKLQKKKPEKKK
jgi:hypothetical protein